MLGTWRRHISVFDAQASDCILGVVIFPMVCKEHRCQRWKDTRTHFAYKRCSSKLKARTLVSHFSLTWASTRMVCTESATTCTSMFQMWWLAWDLTMCNRIASSKLKTPPILNRLTTPICVTWQWFGFMQKCCRNQIESTAITFLFHLGPAFHNIRSCSCQYLVLGFILQDTPSYVFLPRSSSLAFPSNRSSASSIRPIWPRKVPSNSSYAIIRMFRQHFLQTEPPQK